MKSAVLLAVVLAAPIAVDAPISRRFEEAYEKTGGGDVRHRLEGTETIRILIRTARLGPTERWRAERRLESLATDHEEKVAAAARRGLAALAGEAKPPERPLKPVDPAVDVDADVLTGAFENNPVRARKKYANRWMRIEGRLERVTRRRGKALVLRSRDAGRKILCQFLPGEGTARGLGRLEPDADVTLLGKTTGAMVRGALLLERCRLVDPS